MNDPLTDDIMRMLIGSVFDPVPGLDDNSPELFRLAATGNLAAQRRMACSAYDASNDYAADEAVSSIALTEAITFARLAAAQGNDRDKETLVFLLAQFGRWHLEHGRADIGTRLEAAGLNLASDLADAGHEDFAEMISKAADVLPAATFEEASRQREAAREAGYAH